VTPRKSKLQVLSLSTIALVGFTLIQAVGCETHPPAPEVCIDMCTIATELYDDCLDGWGASWEDAGFDGAYAHQTSCETWAWELSILSDNDSLVETCLERANLFESGDCSAYTGIDWNEHP